jgi:phosphate:Na+ symporter
MTLDHHSSLSILLFGVAIFMFGMTEASDSLQKLMANRIREVLGKISDKKFLSVSLGVALTVLLQSSGAVTSMLVGLGAAGVIGLSEVMGIILGSAIGSTVTVQLISFKLTQFGFAIFILSFGVHFLSRSKKLKLATGVGIGFGLLFIGMEFMGIGAKAFSAYPIVTQIFSALSDSPTTAIIITALFTAFVHSSAVVIGFAMSLAMSGVISLTDCMYWIFGANIGTTGTALMAAMGGNHVSRQVAWANTLFKIGGVLVFVWFTPYFVNFMQWMSSDLNRQIANAHTIFNVATVLVFLPFIGIGAKWIERLFPPSRTDRPYRPKFIDKDRLETPALAMAQTHREILRMGDVVLSMLSDCLVIFEQDDPELVESVRERDNKVDILQTEIKGFLIRLGDDDGLNQQIIRNISFVSDLESAADTIEKNILEAAVKAATLKLNFSDEGWREIQQLHGMVYDLGVKSMTCFQLEDYSLAQEVLELKREIRKKEKEFRHSHYERLNQGLRNSELTSSIHLDLMSDLRRVSGLLTSHVYEIIKLHENASNS